MCNGCNSLQCTQCSLNQQMQGSLGYSQAQQWPYLTQADLDAALKKQASVHQTEVDGLSQLMRAQSELITALRMLNEATARLHELERARVGSDA